MGISLIILATDTFKATSSSGLGLWSVSQTWPEDYKQACPEDGGRKYGCMSVDKSKAPPGSVVHVWGGGRAVVETQGEKFESCTDVSTGNHFSYYGWRTVQKLHFAKTLEPHVGGDVTSSKRPKQERMYLKVASWCRGREMLENIWV